MKAYNAKTLAEVALDAVLGAPHFIVGKRYLLYTSWSNHPYDVIVTKQDRTSVTGNFILGQSYTERMLGCFPFVVIKHYALYDSAKLDTKSNSDSEYVWTSHTTGTRIRVSDMETTHLFNSFRMVYNHSVPPAFRVGAFVRWHDVFQWPDQRKADALKALQEELETRSDLAQQERDEYYDIKVNANTLETLLLK